MDASNVNRTTFYFSSDYVGTAEADEGYKQNAHYKNSTIKLKVGYTPNENHEYSLNYIRSVGSKGGLSSTTNNLPTIRKNTFYLLGNSYFTPYLSLDTKLYYDDFYRDYRSTSRWSGSTSGVYDNDTFGGIFTLNYDIADRTNLKVGTNLKRDHHKGTTTNLGTNALTLNQEMAEFTTSVFAQIAQGIWNFRFVLAASYDRNDPINVNVTQSSGSRWAGDPNTEQPVYPGYSLQGIIYYDFGPNNSLHLTMGKKQNIQKMSDRANTTWGGSIPNPDLEPESAINYELGYDLSYKNTFVSAALYFNDMKKTIKSVRIPSPDASGNELCAVPRNANASLGYPRGCSKYENIDLGYVYGFELSAEQGFFDNMLILGANYSYTKGHPKDPLSSDTTFLQVTFGSELIGYPKHMINAKVEVRPIEDLSVMGFMTLQDVLYTNVVDSYDTTTNTYTGHFEKIRNYFTMDLAASYHIGKGFSVNAGAYNVTDRNNYSGSYYFAGRRLYLGIEYNY